MSRKTITIEYCSKNHSYNGKPVTPGTCLAPFVVPETMAKNDNTLIRDNLRTWDFYGADFLIGFKVVPIEEFDTAIYWLNYCVNEFFIEHPDYKKGRCVLGFDEVGYPCLCDKSNRCTGCPHQFENLPRYRSLEHFIQSQSVSLDETTTDYDGNTIGVEIEDRSGLSVEDHVLLGILTDQLNEALDKVDKRFKTILELQDQGYSGREIIELCRLDPHHGYRVINRANKAQSKFYKDIL